MWLTEVMGVLQDLGDAVTHDDLDAYRAALARAAELGVTTEQINDAWRYRATSRIRARGGLPPVTFNARGEIT